VTCTESELTLSAMRIPASSATTPPAMTQVYHLVLPNANLKPLAAFSFSGG